MKNTIITLLVLLSGCATQQQNQSQSGLSEADIFLASGHDKLSNRNAKGAIADLDQAIALCSSQYPNDGTQVYASRGLAETLYYLLKASAEEKNAITVSVTCSEALYLRGFASLDFGRVKLAEEYLKKALDMAPVNSVYLSELGHIYHSQNDWENALAIFREAEEATTYSPVGTKDAELTRAKRGVGYSLIELGQLEAAKAKFEECLEIDKNDERALSELEYIEHHLSKAP